LFERGLGVSECVWRRVPLWAASREVVVVSQIKAEWKFDPVEAYAATFRDRTAVAGPQNSSRQVSIDGSQPQRDWDSRGRLWNESGSDDQRSANMSSSTTRFLTRTFCLNGRSSAASLAAPTVAQEAAPADGGRDANVPSMSHRGRAFDRNDDCHALHLPGGWHPADQPVRTRLIRRHDAANRQACQRK
jgi:hypothetical protein